PSFRVARRQARVPARERSAGEGMTGARGQGSGVRGQGRRQTTEKGTSFGCLRWPLTPGPWSLAPVIGALALVVAAQRADTAEKAGLFFGAGALLLIGCVAACSTLFPRWRS